MKIVQITSRYGTGSIGKICKAISSILTEQGIENYILYSWGTASDKCAIRCTKNGNPFIDSVIAKVSGLYGFCNEKNTMKLIEVLESIKPDIVHLHNLHAHNCNLEKMFDYFRKNKIKIFYTFHDCWAFTGYCMYFDSVECDKWKDECYKCPQYRKYSLFIDRSNLLFNKKKKALEGLDMTIISPSEWLANLTRQSFLNKYPVRVINNGIDLSIFKPRISDFRHRYKCEKEYLIMGIASKWETRKGLDTFVKLSQDLDSSYKIVLVGTNEKIDKRIPNNIISIHRTEGQQELAEIYSAVDVLVNPTMEENFPTVNIEAIACGTPVITYDTGGSSEMIDETCGVSICRGNYAELLKSIIELKESHRLKKEDCINRSKIYSQYDKFLEYVELYRV